MEEKILRYINLIKYLDFYSIDAFKNTDKLINNTFTILPKNIKSILANYIDNKEFKTLINKKSANTKSYNTFCLNLLSILVNRLDTKICYINEKCIDQTFISLKENSHTDLIKNKTVADNCTLILKYKSTNLIFSFSNQSEKNLKDLSNHIYTIDNNKYENIHIIIFKNSEELDEARQVNKSNVYKRSFFTSFDKICAKIIEFDKESYEKVFSIKWHYGKSVHNYKNIVDLHNIDVVDNIPVGIGDSKLYKLTFKTKETIDILPGQFIMINTLKEQKEISKYYQPHIVNSISDINPNIHNDLRTKQISYLKRPFGIYRTYYENFDYDYLSKLNLDKNLATILYTIQPNKFEILYKVLDNGIGTNELTKLAKGDKVEILAPLGKIFDFREILKDDIDEVHIIGGGVGIAPLVYIVQALRYFNIKVKAFIGIEKYSHIHYIDTEEQSFTGTGRNAKIYVDDLKFLGLSETSDIYMSFLSDTEEEKETSNIKNIFKGSFITEPYTEYLKKHHNLKILTFTCGPLPMMQKVHNITSLYNVKSYVLMEKRMACGIGVCFSCVCKTILKGENHYSRVCIDGPIIESKQISWNE